MNPQDPRQSPVAGFRDACELQEGASNGLVKGRASSFHARERVRDVPILRAERAFVALFVLQPVPFIRSQELTIHSGQNRIRPKSIRSNTKPENFWPTEIRICSFSQYQNGTQSVRQSTVNRGSITIRDGRVLETNRKRVSGPLVTTAPNRSTFPPALPA